MTQLSLALTLGDRAMRAAASAGERVIPSLTERASAFMLAQLRLHGPMTGEALTDACREAGLCPSEARAMGCAFKRLVRIGGRIVGEARRANGHGSTGGKLYAA